jgi:transcriptional repressor NF-X1
LNPSPTRESTLKCDEECLRLERNRKLAEALDIDPSTHSDDHIPYSDTTLKLFRENVNWAQGQERELRVFAGSPEEKRLRFKPMPSHQRAFLHSLAEDFGLDSESQDPEPHRHICIFKTPRFVSAPQKTLAQCLRIAKAAASLGTGASSIKPAAPAPPPPQQAFNALLVKNPRFGLTIDELDAAIATDLAAASRSGPAITFTTSFLPSEEVLIKATAHMTTAAIATSLAPTAQAVETTLSNLKVAVARTVSRLGLAGAVALCHVDSSQNITRREGDAAANSGGWSAVAGRGSWKRTINKAPAAGASTSERAPSAFVALRRLEARKKAAALEEEKVEEDWLAAVEREEGAEEAKRGSAGEGVVSDGVDGVVDKEEEGDQVAGEKEAKDVEETQEEKTKLEETKLEETKLEEAKEEEAKEQETKVEEEVKQEEGQADMGIVVPEAALGV